MRSTLGIVAAGGVYIATRAVLAALGIAPGLAMPDEVGLALPAALAALVFGAAMKADLE
jgi:hypothetical protein